MPSKYQTGKKTFNVDLPIEIHASIHSWCYRNNETVMEFCRNAILQRMRDEKIDPQSDIAPLSPLKGDYKSFNSLKEALTIYQELNANMPLPMGDNIYAGTLRVRVKPKGEKTPRLMLVYTPAFENQQAARAWRQLYVDQRVSYLSLENCTIFKLTQRKTKPEDFA